MRITVCTLFLTVLTVGAQQRQVGRGVNIYSSDKEAALGAQLAREFRANTTAINTAVQAYVDRLGRKITAAFSNPRFTYTFAVVKDDVGGQTHEPVSFPAGFIFVPANLILAAENEAELAGMLAHAMAHIAERHGTRLATRSEMAGLGRPLIFTGGKAGIGVRGSEPAVPLAFRRFQRGFEIEADVLAIRLAAGAGYDPNALVTYIARVQPNDSDGAENALARLREHSASLPQRDLRVTRIQNAIQDLPPREYAPTSNEFTRIQADVRRLMRE